MSCIPNIYPNPAGARLSHDPPAPGHPAGPARWRDISLPAQIYERVRSTGMTEATVYRTLEFLAENDDPPGPERRRSPRL